MVSFINGVIKAVFKNLNRFFAEPLYPTETTIFFMSKYAPVRGLDVHECETTPRLGDTERKFLNTFPHGQVFIFSII